MHTVAIFHRVCGNVAKYIKFKYNSVHIAIASVAGKYKSCYRCYLISVPLPFKNVATPMLTLNHSFLYVLTLNSLILTVMFSPCMCLK